MKKRLLALLVLALVMILALASCDPIGDWLNSQNPPPAEPEEYVVYFIAGEGTHVPNQTVTEGGLVTRPEDPTKAGYDFVNWYKDAECTRIWSFDTDKITQNTMIYAKWTPHIHTGGSATCTSGPICDSCGKEYGEPLGHKGGTPTCTDQAVCEVCGKSYGEPLGHDVVIIPGTAPTCTEPGLTDGAYCSECDAKVEQEIIPATGHTVVVDEAVAPTCTEAGLTEGSHCSACDEVLVAQQTVAATGHTWGEWITDTAPTQTTEGTKHRTCGTCGEVETGTIPSLDHTHSYTAEVTEAPTCEEDGVRTYTCTCGDSYTEAIPATGHTEGEVEMEGLVEAGCETDGSYDDVVYCAICDKELSRQTVTLPALGHKDEDGDFKCDNECGKIVEPADGTALTLTQAIALAEAVGSSYTNNKYYITGRIVDVYNTQYGNLHITDGTITDFTVYGLYSADGNTRYDAMSYKPVAGDEITIYVSLVLSAMQLR